ncbi:MAG: hypothetical protein IPN46_20055 [Saprospiraceae bacterium]|nr:hypothetical protein [Saprospiraceae bacterium]
MAKRVVSAVKNIAKGQISKGLKDLSQAAIYYGRGITGWDGTNELGVKSFGQENWNTIVVTAATIAATMALGPGGAAVGAGLSEPCGWGCEWFCGWSFRNNIGWR